MIYFIRSQVYLQEFCPDTDMIAQRLCLASREQTNANRSYYEKFCFNDRKYGLSSSLCWNGYQTLYLTISNLALSIQFLFFIRLHINFFQPEISRHQSDRETDTRYNVHVLVHVPHFCILQKISGKSIKYTCTKCTCTCTGRSTLNNTCSLMRNYTNQSVLLLKKMIQRTVFYENRR